jgi:low affinity Fe/Cu permease
VIVDPAARAWIDARYGRVVLSRWLGGLAALVVTLIACALVILDLTDGGLRRWNDVHALTTDTVAGLLVLLITVLVADQVIRLSQINARARAVAAQAAIVVTQAVRSSQAVSQALAGSGDRDAASDEFRTYMMMLLVGAPVLIDAKVSRNFLEQAQSLGGEMARALAATARTPGQVSYPTARLDDAVQQLRTASTPLLQVLDPETLQVIRGDQPADRG